MRWTIVLTLLALTGCGPSYSPDTYASNAAQQANKVDTGVIVGVRPVAISAQGTVGAAAGAAAGGVEGSRTGVGVGSAMGAIGGGVLGGIAGVTAEHMIADTNGFEYIVKKPNGDLISVAQKDPKALKVGQKVLVIAGPQARIVPDYTVTVETNDKAAKPAAPLVAPSAAAAPVAAQPPVPPPSVPQPLAQQPPVTDAPPRMASDTAILAPPSGAGALPAPIPESAGSLLAAPATVPPAPRP